MDNKVLASILVAASFSFVTPVFASGYGPAPFYHPAKGAPASQRGQSVATLGPNVALVGTSHRGNATVGTGGITKSDSAVQTSTAGEVGVVDGTSTSGSHQD
jgi:hypothetical protein